MKLSEVTAAQPARLKLSDVTGQSPVEQLPTVTVQAPARLPGVLGTINDFGNDLGDATAHHLLNVPVGIGQLLAHGVQSVADTARPETAPSLSSLITGQQQIDPNANWMTKARGSIVDAIDSGVSGLDQSVKKREENYQRDVPTNTASVLGAGVGEILPWLVGAGEVRAAGMLPKAETTLQKLGQLALEGGTIGAAQPVTGDGSYAAQKALQVGVGAATGPVLHGAGKAAGAVRSGVSDVLEHVRDPQAIADRQILARFGNDPQAVTNLRAAIPDVPGERLTAAQANPSPEALAQERVLRNNPATAADFVHGDNANNSARMAVIQKLAGADADLEAAKLARKQATAPFIDQHLTPATPAIRWNDAAKPIDAILQKPNINNADLRAVEEARKIIGQVKGGALQEDDAVGALQELEQGVTSPKMRKAFADAFGHIDRNMIDPKAIIQQLALLRNTGQGARATIRPALDAIANTLRESQNTRGKVPVDVLDSVRQNIKDYIVKPNGALASGQEIAALDPVKAKLTALIDTHAPGYSDYLAAYAKHSDPINTMESVRKLLDPNSPHSLNAAGDPQLTVTRLRQILRGDDKARYPMSEAARKQLDAVRASLERRMISDNKLAASGPGTAADLQAGQGSAIGRGLFGDPLAGKPGALSRSIGIGLGGTLGHMVPIPGAGIAGAMLGGLLPEAAQGVNSKIAQRIGSTALDSNATADAIERALLKQSKTKKPGKLGEMLLLGN